MSESAPAAAAPAAAAPAAAAPAAAAPAAAAPAAAVSTSASEASASNLGKRPRDSWFGAAGDGGSSSSRASAISAKLKQHETSAKVSSIASKLSKPKPILGGSSGSESAVKRGLTREQLLEDQERHRAIMEAKGKAVPHYRKS